MLGTINYRFAGVAEAAPLTTPPALEIFARLAAMRAAGATHVAMEVSSHALAQDRTDGIPWDAAIFTNLGRDHLDFHRDPDDYLRAKARLFAALDASPKAAAGRGAERRRCPRRAACKATIASPIVTFGAGGDVRAEQVEMTLAGTRATLVAGAGRVAIRTTLVGSGHLENVLAAAAAAHALGTPLATIAAALADFPGVPGRLEPVRRGAGFHRAGRLCPHPRRARRGPRLATGAVPGRLICVFGCGGDRDRGKRPLMAEAVGRHVDLAILTSDNPRTEDPARILDDAEPGLERAGLAAAAEPRGHGARLRRAIRPQPGDRERAYLAPVPAIAW